MYELFQNVLWVCISTIVITATGSAVGILVIGFIAACKKRDNK